MSKDIFEIAKWHRLQTVNIVLILLILGAWAAVKEFDKFAGAGASSLQNGLFGAVIVSLVSIVIFTFVLSSKLQQNPVGLIALTVLMAPIAVFVINSMANKRMKNAGLSVGLFGAAIPKGVNPSGASDKTALILEAEKELSNWLAHPNEFGVEPKTIKHLREYKVEMMGGGPTKIQLFSYEMPDGTKGRGFVNPITWSFLGDEINAISDDDLLIAYAGWTFLGPSLQNGGVVQDFVSEQEEANYLAEKASQGLKDVTITNRYKIGTSEMFEFVATFDGKKVKGAGNTQTEVGYSEGDPCYSLPLIYFVLGDKVIK